MWQGYNNCKSHKVQHITLYLQSRDKYKHVYNHYIPGFKSLRYSSGDQQLTS